MDYLEGLRNIILNELNIGGQEVKEENDDDDGDQNFMDDDDNPPAEEPAPAEDAPAPDEGEDDTSDDGGDQNFMDDDGGEDSDPGYGRLYSSGGCDGYPLRYFSRTGHRRPGSRHRFCDGRSARRLFYLCADHVHRQGAGGPSGGTGLR